MSFECGKTKLPITLIPAVEGMTSHGESPFLYFQFSPSEDTENNRWQFKEWEDQISSTSLHCSTAFAYGAELLWIKTPVPKGEACVRPSASFRYIKAPVHLCLPCFEGGTRRTN